MTQIFRVDNPLLGRGLSLAQRLCYINAMLHFLYGLPRLIYLTAPLAYLLSALAGLIYIVATITLARGTRASRRLASVAILIELIGVITVGTVSVVDPEAFPRATVWSIYGIGYGFVPLVLPILGLAWLWHTRPVNP